MNILQSTNKKVEIVHLELKSLLEITQAINQNLPENDLFKIFQFTLLANLNIQKLCLCIRDENEDWDCKVKHGLDHEPDLTELKARFDKLDRIAELNSDAKSCFDKEFRFAIPVLHKKKPLAIIFIELKDNGAKNDKPQEILEFVQTLANVIMVAIENKKLARKETIQQALRESLRKELEIARNVQNYLFPDFLPSSGIVQCFASYLPHETVGGDYYDYIPLDDGRFLICIADVSGKGIPAALLMSNFQASLRTLARRAIDLEDMVRELNFQIKQNAKGEHFITVFIALFDPNTKELSYVNAGHNPPILINGDLKSEMLEAGTTILGFFDPLPFIESVKIEDVDNFLIFTYTDGLTEAMNVDDEQYGIERIEKYISENASVSLDQLHEGLLHEIQLFKGNLAYHDDLTILSCRVSTTEDES